MHAPSWQHSRFFGGFAGFARPLSSRVACVVVYAKVPWLSLHAKYRGSKAKQAAALLYFGSNTHTTQEESADSSRRNVAGPILYCHRYKITCDRKGGQKYCQGQQNVVKKIIVCAFSFSFCFFRFVYCASYSLICDAIFKTPFYLPYGPFLKRKSDQNKSPADPPLVSLYVKKLGT